MSTRKTIFNDHQTRRANYLDPFVQIFDVELYNDCHRPIKPTALLSNRESFTVSTSMFVLLAENLLFLWNPISQINLAGQIHARTCTNKTNRLPSSTNTTWPCNSLTEYRVNNRFYLSPDLVLNKKKIKTYKDVVYWSTFSGKRRKTG